MLRHASSGILLKDVMSCKLGYKVVLGLKQAFWANLLGTLRSACNKSMKLINHCSYLRRPCFKTGRSCHFQTEFLNPHLTWRLTP